MSFNTINEDPVASLPIPLFPFKAPQIASQQQAYLKPGMENIPRTNELSSRALKNRRDINLLIFGKNEKDKKSVIECLLKNSSVSYDDDDEDNQFLKKTIVSLGENTIAINDAQGFRGDVKYDIPLLRQTISKLRPDQPIDMVILCLSFVRFNQDDENILYLLREFTTPAFHRLIRVVITHAPEGVVNVEAKAMIAEKLSFLGNSPDEVLAEKVTFVDLISPLSFPSHLVETQEAIEHIWADTKVRLCDQCFGTDASRSVIPNQVMAKSLLYQFYFIYMRKVFFSTAILIGLILLYLFLYDWMLTEEKLNTCLTDKIRLAEEHHVCKNELHNSKPQFHPPTSNPDMEWEIKMILLRLYKWMVA